MDIFCYLCCLCITVLFVSCSLDFICWERADLLALLYGMFSWVLCSLPIKTDLGVLGQVWYLIVLTPDVCLHPSLYKSNRP